MPGKLEDDDIAGLAGFHKLPQVGKHPLACGGFVCQKGDVESKQFQRFFPPYGIGNAAAKLQVSTIVVDPHAQGTAIPGSRDDDV